MAVDHDIGLSRILDPTPAASPWLAAEYEMQK